MNMCYVMLQLCYILDADVFGDEYDAGDDATPGRPVDPTRQPLASSSSQEGVVVRSW